MDTNQVIEALNKIKGTSRKDDVEQISNMAFNKMLREMDTGFDKGIISEVLVPMVCDFYGVPVPDFSKEKKIILPGETIDYRIRDAIGSIVLQCRNRIRFIMAPMHWFMLTDKGLIQHPALILKEQSSIVKKLDTTAIKGMTINMATLKMRVPDIVVRQERSINQRRDRSLDDADLYSDFIEKYQVA